MTPQAKLNSLILVSNVEERKVMLFGIAFALNANTYNKDKDLNTAIFSLGEYITLDRFDKKEIIHYCDKQKEFARNIFTISTLNSREEIDAIGGCKQVLGADLVSIINNNVSVFKRVVFLTNTLLKNIGENDD